MTTFAELYAANDEALGDASRGLHFDILCALGEAADNAVQSERFDGKEFVLVTNNQHPLFDEAALASLETAMAFNVLSWSDEQHAAVTAWLASQGFTF